jgi:hypothetical protein
MCMDKQNNYPALNLFLCVLSVFLFWVWIATAYISFSQFSLCSLLVARRGDQGYCKKHINKRADRFPNETKTICCVVGLSRRTKPIFSHPLLHPPYFFLFVHSLKPLWHISCQPHVKSVYDWDGLAVDGETWRFMQQENRIGVGVRWQARHKEEIRQANQIESNMLFACGEWPRLRFLY